jgi:hypothetical protein
MEWRWGEIIKEINTSKGAYCEYIEIHYSVAKFSEAVFTSEILTITIKEFFPHNPFSAA